MNYSRLTKRGVGGLSPVGASLHFVEMRHDIQVFVDRCKYIISDRGEFDPEKVRRDYEDISRNMAWIDRAVRSVAHIDRVKSYYLAIPSTQWHDIPSGVARVSDKVSEAYAAYEAARRAVGEWVHRALRFGYLQYADLPHVICDALDHYRDSLQSVASEALSETPYEDRPGMWQVGTRGDARRQALKPMRVCVKPLRLGFYAWGASVLMTRYVAAQVESAMRDWQLARRRVGVCAMACQYAYEDGDDGASVDLYRYFGLLRDEERMAYLKFANRVGRASYHDYRAAYAIVKHARKAFTPRRNSSAWRYLNWTANALEGKHEN